MTYWICLFSTSMQRKLHQLEEEQQQHWQPRQQWHLDYWLSDWVDQKDWPRRNHLKLIKQFIIHCLQYILVKYHSLIHIFNTSSLRPLWVTKSYVSISPYPSILLCHNNSLHVLLHPWIFSGISLFSFSSIFNLFFSIPSTPPPPHVLSQPFLSNSVSKLLTWAVALMYPFLILVTSNLNLYNFTSA